MKRLTAVAIPVLLIGCFVLIMLSASVLKMPRGESDNVPDIISDIEADVNKDNWESAAQNVKRLENAWSIIVKRVQFSAERDDLVQAEANIARAKGYIAAKNKGGTFSELYEAKEHWNNIGN